MTTGTSDELSARALLRVPPEEYVSERSRLVRLARAAGDRGLAKDLGALKRPNQALWAVLAAADDADAVRRVVDATVELAAVQARGGDRDLLAAAGRRRRVSIDAFVAAAVAARGRWSDVSEARRAEIRGIVDQLSRCADLAGDWIDGTLRDLPEDSLGFAAFDAFPVPDRPDPPPDGKAPETKGRPQPTAADAAASNVRSLRAGAARRELVAANEALRCADERVSVARRDHERAEEQLRAADDERAVAQRQVDEAIRRVDRLPDP